MSTDLSTDKHLSGGGPGASVQGDVAVQTPPDEAAVIGEEAMLAAGTVVHDKTVIPDRRLAAGVPPEVRHKISFVMADHMDEVLEASVVGGLEAFAAVMPADGPTDSPVVAADQAAGPVLPADGVPGKMVPGDLPAGGGDLPAPRPEAPA